MMKLPHHAHGADFCVTAWLTDPPSGLAPSWHGPRSPTTDPPETWTVFITFTDLPPALIRTGEQVVCSIGGFGVLNLDEIRTSDGELVVLDVNQRPWGAMVALRGAGTDFVAAWLAALRGTQFPRQTVPAGRRVIVFSTTAINQGFRAPFRGLREFTGTARTYAQWTGRGYIAAEWVRATAVVARCWSRKTTKAV